VPTDIATAQRRRKRLANRIRKLGRSIENFLDRLGFFGPNTFQPLEGIDYIRHIR
jgi:hypothetical protein